MFIVGFNFKIWERYFAQTNQQHDSRDSSTSGQSNKTDEYIINRAARFKNVPWSEGTRTFTDSKYTAGNLEASIRGVLRNFAKFTGKHLCQSFFFQKVAGLRSEFWKISNNTFFVEHFGRLLQAIVCSQWRLSMIKVVNVHCVKRVQIRSFSWSVYSCIRTEWGKIRSISPDSVQMPENTD